MNRFELLRRAERSGVLSRRAAAVPMSNEEVFRRYRGLDGLPWPQLEHPGFETVDGLAKVPDLQQVCAYLSRLPRKEECDLIAIADARAVDVRLSGWNAAGFDVGYFESEWSHFSVLLSEVIYGSQPALRRFAAVLNENLLAPTLDIARELVAERARLAATGADVEAAASIEAICIFLREPELTNQNLD